MYGEELHYRRKLLNKGNSFLLSDFDCGNDEINDFLKNKALYDSSKQTYLYISDNKLLGFVSLACSGIKHSYEKTSYMLSAIEIKYFAIDIKYHAMLFDENSEESNPESKNYTLSDHIFANILEYCSKIANKVIGAKYIILYSVPQALHFYILNGFSQFDEYMKKNHIKYLDGCIPMYMEIYN